MLARRAVHRPRRHLAGRRRIGGDPRQPHLRERRRARSIRCAACSSATATTSRSPTTCSPPTARSPPDFESNRSAGIRGGIYVRFAGALTTQLSTSSGRKPALRVHDNRVDQPAGRALTAFAFGPVSVANNHFNSEFTGRFGFLDTVRRRRRWSLNLGGIHRCSPACSATTLVTRQPRPATRQRASPRSPSGRCRAARRSSTTTTCGSDSVNRSIMAQALLCCDDLGYAIEHRVGLPRQSVLLPTRCSSATACAPPASRLREDATRTLSLLTMALRMNMTALNQADHCIVALPPAGASPLPTVDDAEPGAGRRRLPSSCSPSRPESGDSSSTVLAATPTSSAARCSERLVHRRRPRRRDRSSRRPRRSLQVNATQVATTQGLSVRGGTAGDQARRRPSEDRGAERRRSRRRGRPAALLVSERRDGVDPGAASGRTADRRSAADWSTTAARGCRTTPSS